MNLREFLGHVHVHFATDEGLLTFPALDPPRPHSELWLKGDVRSEPENLDYPHDIAFLLYEDMPIADNYRDLAISANPIMHGGEQHFVAVFWAEGAFEKWVCFDLRLIHHYESNVPESYYGIFATYDLPYKGPCPFSLVLMER